MTLISIKTLFEQIISDSKWWAKFKDSEFAKYIITFVAQVYFRAEQVAARRLQEAFLSLALKMSSVLAHAESRGYVAKKRIPTKKSISIKNNSNETQYIPAKTKLYSSDSGLHFLIENALTIEPNVEYISDAIQAQIVNFESTVEDNRKFLEKKLDVATSSRIASMKVSVKEPSGTKKLWEQSYLFRNTNDKSLSYVEFYTSTQQLGVRFGNGISGRIPSLGSTVYIECLVTDGFTELSEGVKLDILDNPSIANVLVITSKDTLVSGSEREDMESLRNNALYFTSYDNTVVYDGDYEFFTRQNISGLSWFRVWGEKEQEKLTGRNDLDFSTRVYLSAYHPKIGQEALMQSLGSLYSGVKTLNITYTPTECKTEPFTIELSGKILSTQKVDETKNVIIKTLNDVFSSAVSNHNGDISYDAIWSEIKKLNVLTRYNLKVNNVDLDIQAAMDTFRYLDVDNSIINITY